MDQSPIIGILFFAFLVLIVIVAIASAKARDKRYQELMALAQKHGLTFLPGGMQLKEPTFSLFGSNRSTSPIADFTDFFPLFSQGSSKRIEPAIVGKDKYGTYWHVFDYQYEETSDDSTTTYRFSVVVAMLPMDLPAMTLSLEGTGHKIGKFFGARELEVESEAFNRRYFIKTSNDKMALDLLHPTAIEALLAQPPLEWQMTGPFIMLHLPELLSADEYEGMMGFIKQFLDKIPNYYREDHGYTGAAR